MNDLMTITGQGPVVQPQAELVVFVQAKLAEAELQLKESEEALAYAKSHKWNTKRLTGIVNRHRKQAEYLEKARQAAEAGYVVMPAISGDTFAVRVGARARMPSHTTKDPSNWNRPADMIPEVRTDSPPAGEGGYVAPEVQFHCDWYQREQDGKIVKYRGEIGDEFISEIPFPVLMAKPVLMDATERAMALRIFDDIGIFPGRRQRKADPIIYGRIHRPGREPLYFLIC